MDASPEKYETLRGDIAYSYVKSSLDFHLPLMEWSDDDIILDIGCGPGKTTKEIFLPKCPKFKKIVAIDIDSAYIEYAQKIFSHKKIEYQTRNILESLNPEEVGKFDKVVSFLAFHLICDYEKFFSNVSSVLKPGGYFLFVTGTKLPMFEALRQLSSDEEWTKFIKSEDVLAVIPPSENWKDSKTEFKNIVSEFGLRVTNNKCEFVNFSFCDMEHVLDLSMAALPRDVFKSLETETKKRLWRKADPILMKNCTQKTNGDISLTSEVLQVSGIKSM